MLMTRSKKVEELVLGLTSTLTCPITLKMRTGWNENTPIAHSIMRRVDALGTGRIAAFMLHGRSRLQRYSKAANWDYITRVAKGGCRCASPPRPFSEARSSLFYPRRRERERELGRGAKRGASLFGVSPFSFLLWSLSLSLSSSLSIVRPASLCFHRNGLPLFVVDVVQQLFPCACS